MHTLSKIAKLAFVLLVLSTTTVKAQDGKQILNLFGGLIGTAIQQDQQRKQLKRLETRQRQQSLLSQKQLFEFFRDSVIYGANINGGNYWTLNFKNNRAKFTYSNGRTNSTPAGILGNRICFIFGGNTNACRQVRVWNGRYTWVDAASGQDSSHILFRQSNLTDGRVNQRQLSCPPRFERNCAQGVLVTSIN